MLDAPRLDDVGRRGHEGADRPRHPARSQERLDAERAAGYTASPTAAAAGAGRGGAAAAGRGAGGAAGGREEQQEEEEEEEEDEVVVVVVSVSPLITRCTC